MRDRPRTEQKLIHAVGTLLAREGFQGMGVNAVAREAGVDKKLIYRYFGGLPELLDAYAASQDFWPAPSDLLPEETEDPAALAATILKRHLRSLRNRPLTQEIMRWELLERSDLTDRLAEAREASGHELLAQFGGTGDGQAAAELPDDLPAVAAVLHAGLSYLVLRSKTADEYIGVDLTSNEGWQRLESAVDALVRAYFDAPGGSPSSSAASSSEASSSEASSSS